MLTPKSKLDNPKEIKIARARETKIAVMQNHLPAKLLAEFIGTFAFVFIGAGTAAVVGEGVGMPGIVAIAFAHGLAIMAFACAYGSVSAGHFNPAVTVGVHQLVQPEE